jgi:hypothetical protein
LTKQGGIGLNMPMPPSKIKNHEIMKNLNQRKKLQICKAHVINAMEEFLSSVMNANFSEAFSAEFVANVRIFDLTQQHINGAAYNAELVMYPHRTEQYGFTKHDGSISIQAVLIALHRSKNSYGENEKKIPTKGFEENMVSFIYEVFVEDGISQLGKKITTIQSEFDCFIQNEAGARGHNLRADSYKVLMQTMLKIIETLDPEVFFSKGFQEKKSWLLSED